MAARTQPTKFDLRREATRAELIRLGIERFPLKGYSSTSIEDIVRDSTLSRGAYYFHFSSKEDLFLACLEARAAARAGWPETALDPGITSIDDAIGVSFERFQELEGPYGLDWAILQTDFSQMARRDPELMRRFHDLHGEWLREFERFIEHCATRGFIELEGPYDEVAAAAMALSQGMSIDRSLYGDDTASLPKMMGRLLRA